MEDLYIQAEAFIASMQQFEPSPTKSEKWTERLKAIKASIQSTGTYTHNSEELIFGAKLAWRNSNRCIGRHFWRQLDVFDCRSISSEDAVSKALKKHIKHAFNKGSIKSTISIFAPREQNSKKADKVRIQNHQLIRYAGFSENDGSILGDPHSQAFTQACLQLGWEPHEKTNFTPLPWAISIDGKPSLIYDIFKESPNLLNEVALEHPENEAFKKLSLKWYAMPILSDMALVIGGIVYPCAPFNGWYMGTEIGARNLADEARYNLLPEVAECFNLNTKTNRSLWRDRAIVELNRAVLYSYDRDQIKIGDHHATTRQFENFCTRQTDPKKAITGDWTWLVPPISASQTPTFSQEFDPAVTGHTNFFYQKPQYSKPKENEESRPSKCPYHLS